MNKNKKNSLYRLWKKSKKQMWLIILLTFLNMLVSASYVVPALISRLLINTASSAASFNEVSDKIVLYTCALIAFVIIVVGLMVLNSHLRAVITGRLEKEMRSSFFENIVKKEYSEITKLHSGEILNRFTSDIDIVVSGITSFVPEAISVLTKVIAGFVFIAVFNINYALFILLVGIFILSGAVFLKRFYKRIHKQTQEASGIMRGFTQECIENTVVVKTFSNSEHLLKKLDAYLKNIYDLKIKRNNISNVAGGGATLIYKIVYYATLCWGAFMIAGKSMDYGTLMAFMQIVSQISSPFFNASSLLTKLYSAMASAERLAELEDLADEASSSSFDADFTYKNMSGISVEGVSFGYGKEQIMTNTSFFVPKGSCVAVTGLSGTGKSTLFKLLLGLYVPSSGGIFTETATDKIKLSSATRSLFAYVPQGNMLISGSISENISFGKRASAETIAEAAKTACIYDFITSLPDGFETKIGEHGLGLSEGQIQRIAIARALCCDSGILLLDECTSALDMQTEEKLLENIKKLNTKTIFFISHKNAALSICDMHLNLDNGKFIISE